MKRWTEEESAILIEYYPIEGPDIINRLPGRTLNAIKNRAQQLNIVFRKEMYGWTTAEVSILKTFYPTEGKKVCQRLPGRTIKTIQAYAHRLGIKKNKYEV